jgi:hypothetical protein
MKNISRARAHTHTHTHTHTQCTHNAHTMHTGVDWDRGIRHRSGVCILKSGLYRGFINCTRALTFENFGQGWGNEGTHV